MFRTQTLSLVLLLSALSPFASAQAQAPPATEPESKQAYELKVVLHVADNPALTDVFGDRLDRELGDSLQADFGDLVHVEVVRAHPLLKDVLEKGLATALKSRTDRDGVKTHFVLIDFNGVDYQIQSCQYDGVTGQPNPVVVVEKDRNPIVRTEKTRDREFVAKSAALMVERDFGLIASFPSWPDNKTKPQTVQLTFRGSDLAQLDRFVKKGDVFAVVQMPNGNGASQTIPDAVVQMEDAPKDGVGRGKLFWRYALPPGGAVSYRCVKLGTVAGPVRVRVMVKQGGGFGTTESALQIRNTGFNGEAATMLKVDTKAGLYDSSRDKNNGGKTFDQLAFISVVEGVKGDVRAEVPVPLFSDQPYVIKLSNQADTDPFIDLEKLAWNTNVRDTFEALEYIVQDMQHLATKEGMRSEIIKKGQDGLNRASEDYPKLVAKREELFKSPTPAEQRELKVMNQRLKTIGDRMNELRVFVEAQRKIDTEEKSPEKVAYRAKVEQGKLLEQDLEYGKAIALYKSLPKAQVTPELTKWIQQLETLWNEHADDADFKKARTFIYDVFPTLKDSADVQMRLEEAKKAAAECQRVNDKIAAQKFMINISRLLPKLAKEGEELNPINGDAALPLKRLKEVGEALEKLTTELKIYLDQQKGS